MAPRQPPPAHDERWFEDVYRTHHAAVLGYARRRVGDPDDVVAEVFAAAWRSRDRVPDPPLPWLYRTASNHVLHATRAQGRRGRLRGRVAGLATTAPDHADAVAGRLDASSRVRQALEHLSGGDRELLRLLAWEELTHEQLAYVLRCSAPALRVRLHRARARFAAQLDELDRAADDRAADDRARRPAHPSAQETRP